MPDDADVNAVRVKRQFHLILSDGRIRSVLDRSLVILPVFHALQGHPESSSPVPRAPRRLVYCVPIGNTALSMMARADLVSVANNTLTQHLTT